MQLEAAFEIAVASEAAFSAFEAVFLEAAFYQQLEAVFGFDQEDEQLTADLYLEAAILQLEAGFERHCEAVFVIWTSRQYLEAAFEYQHLGASRHYSEDDF